MAKLNPNASRHLSALAETEDDAFLRPATRPRPEARPRAARELVPNYDPADLRGDEAEPFLRARRRVPPRKGGFWRTLARSRFGRVLLGALVLLALGLLGASAWAVHSFLEHDPHFRIDSSASIQATGTTELSRAELLGVFGSDIGRNVFFVPLARREAALEAKPWVRHATVMRLLPNTLLVAVEERVPVAFVRVGRQIELVDGEGMLLSMSPATLAARHYSFPVVSGLDPNISAEARAARMRLFGAFVAALDAGGRKISSQLSEVNLQDQDDVQAVVPAEGTDILLHFGNSDFLERYRSFEEHLPEWRQQYPHLSAVDLRYDRQVVLKMADAAQADEAAAEAGGNAPAQPARRPAPPPPPARKPAAAHSVAHAAPRPASRLASRPASHAASHARTWYTERRGAHGAVRWVPHPAPTRSGGAQ